MRKTNNAGKILITGGGGYVGSVLIPLLLKKGYFVRVVDDLIFNQNPPAVHSNRFQFIKGRIGDERVLNTTLKNVGIIVHLAALVGEPACHKNPGLCYEINERETAELNNVRGTIPLIFTSTSSVYGETTGKVCFEDSTRPKPVLPYARSKYKAEQIIKESGNCIILRPATAFGISPRMRLDLLVNEFVFRALKDRYLELYNPGFTRTFIHVRDFTRAILMMVERFNDFEGQIFNLGANEMNVAKREVADLIRSKVDFELKIVPGDSDSDGRNFIVNYDKIRKAGFNTEISLEDGINELVEGCRDLGDNSQFYNRLAITSQAVCIGERYNTEIAVR